MEIVENCNDHRTLKTVSLSAKGRKFKDSSILLPRHRTRAISPVVILNDLRTRKLLLKLAALHVYTGFSIYKAKDV
jgi:hypothetical protein